MKKIFFLFTALVGIFSLSLNVAKAETVMCTMEYSPVCGQPPMASCPSGMSCAQVMPAPKVYSNKCVMRADGATLVNEGLCRTVDVYQKDVHGCAINQGFIWSENLGKCIQSENIQNLIDWAYANNLTKYSNASDFKPNNTLTRQEAAAIATRIVKNILKKESSMATVKMRAYDDQSAIDETLQPDVMKARFLGIMNGNNNIFSPKNLLTFAETSAMLVRIIDGTSYDSGKPWFASNVARLSEFGGNMWDGSNMVNYMGPISRGEFLAAIYTIFHDNSVYMNSQKMQNDSNLVGKWTLVSFNNNNFQQEARATIEFTPSEIRAKICNTIFGKYTATNGKFGKNNFSSTLMYCSGMLGEIENSFISGLDTYTISNDKKILTITTKDQKIFIFQKAGSENYLEKIQGKWHLIEYEKMNYDAIKA